MRTPDPLAEPTGQPRGGLLYCVRFIDTRGQAVTELFRVRDAASRYAARVRARGGEPRTFVTRLGAWKAC